ncbi:MAG TPA: hypothetical protein VM737_09700 [Gemmatimonadota bacterium]|nr:hypothetical protein [Gemmatimonadota bacterium]
MLLMGAVPSGGAQTPLQGERDLSQEPGASGWVVGFRAGGVWVDGLAQGADAQWTAVAGARLAYRVTSQVAIGVDVWGAGLERVGGSGTIRAGGPHLVLTPLAERASAVDPVLDFGVETVRLNDGEDRGAALVFGAGLRRRWGSRWSIEGLARNRLLTIEEEPFEGVATGRDADLWEVALELAWTSGGHGR